MNNLRSSWLVYTRSMCHVDCDSVRSLFNGTLKRLQELWTCWQVELRYVNLYISKSIVFSGSVWVMASLSSVVACLFNVLALDHFHSVYQIAYSFPFVSWISVFPLHLSQTVAAIVVPDASSLSGALLLASSAASTICETFTSFEVSTRLNWTTVPISNSRRVSRIDGISNLQR